MTKSELNALACDLRATVLKRGRVEDIITEVWQVIDKMYEYYRDWPEETSDLDEDEEWKREVIVRAILGEDKETNPKKNDPLAFNPNAPPFPKS